MRKVEFVFSLSANKEKKNGRGDVLDFGCADSFLQNRMATKKRRKAAKKRKSAKRRR